MAGSKKLTKEDNSAAVMSVKYAETSLYTTSQEDLPVNRSTSVTERKYADNDTSSTQAADLDQTKAAQMFSHFIHRKSQ